MKTELREGLANRVTTDDEWTAWEQRAVRRGVSPEFAQLGRQALDYAQRLPADHVLCDELGLSGHGESLLLMSLVAPQRTRSRLEYILSQESSVLFGEFTDIKSSS